MLDKLVGRYRLVRRIGVGGMSDVYLATTPDRGGARRRLALKMVRDSHAESSTFVRALINEARLAVSLTHSNIVQILDVGRVEGRYYVAMEFVDGVDLDELFCRCKQEGIRIPSSTIAFVAHQICRALHYAHTRTDRDGRPLRIVHRDVSPQNILLGLGGDVKLTDFGIAKANVERIKTAANVVKGKYEYMSPEHAWGDELDARADVFSLGVVLYELLTGKIPLQSVAETSGPLKRLNDLRVIAIPPAGALCSDVPAGLDDVVTRALVRDREARYQTAEHMRRDLERFLAGDFPGPARDGLMALLRRVFPERTLLASGDPEATRIYGDSPLRRVDEMPRDTASLIFDMAEEDEAATSVYDEPPIADASEPVFEEPPTIVEEREEDEPPEFVEPPTTLLDREPTPTPAPPRPPPRAPAPRLAAPPVPAPPAPAPPAPAPPPTGDRGAAGFSWTPPAGTSSPPVAEMIAPASGPSWPWWLAIAAALALVVVLAIVAAS